MPFHHEESGANVHVIHRWTYADETARLAAVGFLAADVGGVAFQEDTQDFYVLCDENPITWKPLATGGVYSGTFYGVHPTTGASVLVTVVGGQIVSVA